MSKTTGLGDNFYVGGYDLSGDVNSFTITSPLQLDEVPGIDVLAQERIGLQRDGAMDLVNYFNPATARAHPVYSALPTADAVATVCVSTALGSPAAAMVAKQIGYDPARAANGSLRCGVNAQANGYGLEWGVQLTAGKRTDTDETDGSSVDTGGSLSFGGQAWLQVFEFTGTDATITIQDSADDSSFADVSGLVFTEVTAAPTAERISISNTATIRRYVRAVTTTSAGFTSLTFAVMLRKNEIAGTVF
jgi:hypothetical protein